MIFVTTGTHFLPFDRLLKMVNHLHISEPLVVQSGTSKIIVKNAYQQPYFSYQNTIKFIKQSRLVITAAGPATIFQTLQYNKNKPLVVPRLKKYHEHVSDHQLAFAQHLSRKKIITLIQDKDQVVKSINKPLCSSTPQISTLYKLTKRLNDYLST